MAAIVTTSASRRFWTPSLSKQLSTLENAGYIEVRKGFVGKRPRTSARLTTAGRTAFEQHVLALHQIVATAGASVLAPADPPQQP
jgi:DNA-binding MarR family transcriptional regulator